MVQNKSFWSAVAVAIALSAMPVEAARNATPGAQQERSPASRAAMAMRSQVDRVRSATAAADFADKAAAEAVAAAEAAERAARKARQAADGAVAAAKEAKRALADARASARLPRAPMPGSGGPPVPALKIPGSGAAAPEISPDSPAARAFRAKMRRLAARNAGPKRAPAKAKAQRPAPGPTVLRVGPREAFSLPSQAARVARDGDIIEIAAGTYSGDVAVWRADNLTLRGIGGRAHLKAAGKSAGGKAIWVIAGDNAVVENIEFSGAKVRSRNGAGIRLGGTGLTVRNSYFHHNQMGILTGKNPDSDIVIENSEFAHNIVSSKRKSPLGHNIYIGEVRSFTLRNSYVHHATFGHNVKSRAAVNRILYNRLADEGDGRSSYSVDLPNGGAAYLVGNVIQQSRLGDNWSLVNFASNVSRPDDRLYLANNTLVSERNNARFVSNRSDKPAVLVNNILVGKGKPVQGPARLVANLIVSRTTPAEMARLQGSIRLRKAGGAYAGNFVADRPGFADIGARDYRLSPYSPAIDIGRDAAAEVPGLVPEFEFSDRFRQVPRRRHGPIDLGAFEFAAN